MAGTECIWPHPATISGGSGRIWLHCLSERTCHSIQICQHPPRQTRFHELICASMRLYAGQCDRPSYFHHSSMTSRLPNSFWFLVSDAIAVLFRNPPVSAGKWFLVRFLAMLMAFVQWSFTILATASLHLPITAISSQVTYPSLYFLHRGIS